ncbi:hypothetical protein HDU93_007124, partial [Gonapodya sp. JEL0774]
MALIDSSFENRQKTIRRNLERQHTKRHNTKGYFTRDSPARGALSSTGSSRGHRNIRRVR